jgi:hypothetical protein
MKRSETPPEHVGLPPVKWDCKKVAQASQLFTTVETSDEDQTATSWFSLAIGNTLWCVSKLFANHGDHAEHFLNESLLCSTWLSNLGPDGGVFKAGSLPSVKGSRQMITVELATHVLLNRRGFLKHLRQNSANKRFEGNKVRDANQLIKCAVAGLGDHFVVCGMLARAVFFVAVGNLARFLLNTEATRCGS